jgi:hypothetical protein
MRRFLPLFAVAVLAMALAAVALAATPVHSELSMKLNKSGSALKGKLTSTKASCVKGGIEVVLYWQQTDATGYDDVASAHTNTDGTYKIPGPSGDSIPPGKYYGTTAKSGKCPATKSDKVNIPVP